MKLARAIAIGAIWYLSWTSFLLFTPVRGALVMLCIGGAFAWRYLLRSSSARTDGTRTPRLRVLAQPLAVATASYLVLELSVVVLYTRLTGIPQAGPAGRFGTYAQQPLGWLPLVTIAVVVAPLMEEQLFRGVLLRALSTRMGRRAGIAVSALLFAMVHGSLWALPLHVLFGITAALLATASGSLWPSVALHAIANMMVPISALIAEAAMTIPAGSHLYAFTEAVALIAACAGSILLIVAIRRVRQLCALPSRAPHLEQDAAMPLTWRRRHAASSPAVHLTAN